MRGRQHLRSLYDRWALCSERELKAIEAEAWAEVEAVQREKQQLQGLILSASEDLRQTVPDFEREFRPLLQELMAKEEQNGALLAERIRSCAARKQETQRTVRNLERLQRSYGTAAQAVWSSYS